MASIDDLSPAEPDLGELAPTGGRIRRAFRASRALVRLVHRDPEHVAERLTLYSVARLGGPSGDWARSITETRPDTPAARVGEDLRLQTAQIARIDGAISGTPFFIALVPGYITYLWQEMRMTLRIAALHGRDPTDLRTAGEMLALRGVHPSVENAGRKHAGRCGPGFTASTCCWSSAVSCLRPQPNRRSEACWTWSNRCSASSWPGRSGR
jgi:hypothetical protein